MKRTLLAVAVLLAWVGSASAQPTEAGSDPNAPRRITGTVSTGGVYTRDGASIIFASNRFGGDATRFDVWRMRADGTNAQPLITGEASDDDVAISPDGTRIAFRSNRDGNPEIYVANIDGSDQQRLTNHPERDIHPQWSPDGTEILFNSARDYPDPHGQQFELFAVRVADGRLRRITEDGALNTYGVFSPDGRRIVLRKQVGENSEIYLMNANGRGTPRNLTNHPAYDSWPSWSPDGRSIVFASNRSPDSAVYEIYLMRADGSDLRQITTLGVRSAGPVFAPDGRSILFTRSNAGIADLFSVAVPADWNAGS